MKTQTIDHAAATFAGQFASVWPTFSRDLPGVIDRYCDRLDAAGGVLGDLVKGSERVQFRSAQLSHWRLLLDSPEEGPYAASVARLVTLYQKAGVQRELNTEVCRLLVGEMLKAVARSNWRRFILRGPGYIARTMAVVAEAVLDDLGMVLRTSAQADQLAQAASAREMTEDFEFNAGLIVRSVAEAAKGLGETARMMATTAERTSACSATVAAAASQATANVTVVAASADEMGRSIAEIAHQVGHSTAITSRAVAKAESANVTLESLGRAAKKIDKIVELISEIAAQTNMLALNATIESARAGEAGRGFAVVASEVKTLATQTAKATQDIKAQIHEMQTVALESAEAIGAITAIIDEMKAVSGAINAAVDEQSAATEEIVRSTYEAAAGAREVSQTIVDVQDGAAKAGEASSHVVSASEDLSATAQSLELAVAGFMTNFRGG